MILRQERRKLRLRAQAEAIIGPMAPGTDRLLHHLSLPTKKKRKVRAVGNSVSYWGI